MSDYKEEIDEKSKLMRDAFELITNNPEYSTDWYLELDSNDLQMLSSGIGDMLYSINILISILRGEIISDTSVKWAIRNHAPLLDIEIKK